MVPLRRKRQQHEEEAQARDDAKNRAQRKTREEHKRLGAKRGAEESATRIRRPTTDLGETEQRILIFS
jgi:hypothetical protein